MARLLVAPWYYPGHLLPLLAIAEEVARRGHETFVYAEPAAVADVGLAGCTAVPSAAPDGGETIRLRQLDGDYPGILAGIEAIAATTAEDLGAVIARTRPDAILTDVWQLGAVLAAERAALPWAAMATTPVQPSVRWGATAFREVPTAALRRRLGLPETAADAVDQAFAGRRTLLPWTTEFDFDEPPPRGLHIGPVSWDPPGQVAPAWLAARDPARPLVVVTLTTMQVDGVDWSLRFLEAALEALGTLDVDAVVTLGGIAGADGFTAPPNVRIERFVPHGLLVPLASAVVTHAGWGMIGRALTAGVPLVTIPVALDQPLLGFACATAGVGKNIPARRVSARTLSLRLREVLPAESPERAAARRVAEEIRALSPRQLGASALLEACGLAPAGDVTA